MKNKSQKARHYSFTINNYGTKELQQFQEVAKSLDKHRYICYGLEVGEKNETQHIQGYIQLKESQRFRFLHKYFNLKRENKKIHRFHIEVSKGSAEENKTYCAKEGTFYEFGDMVNVKGQRTDMQTLRELVMEKPGNVAEIVREHCTNTQQIKYVEALARYQFVHRDRNNPPKVYWIFGSTGVGKTRLVHETFKSVCVVSDPRWPGAGYSQQECLLFDDFRSGDMAFNFLLQITDRFEVSLPVKGGDIPLNSPFIIFTAPISINQMYRHESEDVKQLLRRITQIDLDIWEDEISKIDLYNLDNRYIHQSVIKDMNRRSQLSSDEFNFDE